jgi:mono/diheme cytochrome c family protein
MISAMIRAVVALLAVFALHAQTGSVERGAQLYRANCAVPYCHGAEGAAGRAPKLIGHTHSINSMFKMIVWGIPGTGMPEFTTRLKTGEIADIVAYVMTMRGAPSQPAPPPPSRSSAPEASPGRALFFDAARAGACGTCHELDGWGVPVGPDLAASRPERLADLRGVPGSRVRTARPAGEAEFPALVVERTDTRVRVYDLTSPLPVLRTFTPPQVTISPNTSWQHAQSTRQYSDPELEAIGRYLRSRLKP